MSLSRPRHTRLTTILILIAAAAQAYGAGTGIGNLQYLRNAYPDVGFERSYDREENDWKITVLIPDGKDGARRVESFYWADGSMLPASELKNKDMYWPLLYEYPETLPDPAEFSEEEKAAIRAYSSAESRSNGAGTPMFFFDALYDSASRGSTETHIVRIPFLGKKVNVHERIREPLAAVERKILALAATNKEVKGFVDGLRTTDAYYWRIIDGTNRRSFHSLGTAIDILPKNQGGKQIFWGWAKDKYPETWMLIPLNQRWMPPEPVIRAFEEEGFIWGGKWTIWDNMHFEYHPELILYNKIVRKP